MIARLLVAAMILLDPTTGLAGTEFVDADQAVMVTPGTIDNSVAGETRIESFVDDGITDWKGGLDQPEDNTLVFDLPGGATHTNRVGAGFDIHLRGNVLAPEDSTLVFNSPFGVFVGSEAVLDVGSLVAIGGQAIPNPLNGGSDLLLDASVENLGAIRAAGDVFLLGRNVENRGEISTGTGELLMLAADSVHFEDTESVVAGLLDAKPFYARMRGGEVTNTGAIESASARLLGGRVLNQGAIEVADGTLMMLGADAVYLRAFDDPVLVRLPHRAPVETDAPGETESNTRARVENHGRLDAGAGHVRLAASDPLGWAIRQGTGAGTEAAATRGARITIEGGEDGRIELAGAVESRGVDTASDEASDDATPREVGGRIDVTGDFIVLRDATLTASGASGGGTIHIGGEQQGGGDLPRARAVVVDAASEIRADAGERGDGGRVIVFAEDLTSIAGELSARGGANGGGGGFVETSGLAHFEIATTPDVSAVAGEAGDWLIDPYSIEIVADDPALDCLGAGQSCLNRAVEAILAPSFDTANFDDVLRSVAPTGDVPAPNTLSVDLLERALAVGTNLTLSTESFRLDGNDPPEGGGVGDIRISAPITLRDEDTLVGTRARLTLRAAGSIFVDEAITTRDAGAATPADLVLSVELRANDQAQRSASLDFADDQLRGDVHLNADIRTGGGDLVASGVSVLQSAAGNTIETDGGDVTLTSGSLGRNDTRATILRRRSDPEAFPPSDPGDPMSEPTSYDPRIVVAGTIDTSNGTQQGGDLSLTANGLLVQTQQGGDDPVETEVGELEVTGTLRSGVSGVGAAGGGDITLAGGTRAELFAGNVRVVGAGIESAGGDITLDANRVDPSADVGSFDPIFTGGSSDQGGSITIDGATITSAGGTTQIGSAFTHAVSVDGTVDTTGGPGQEQGLLAIAAGDRGAVDPGDARYGRGAIRIGTNAATTLRSAGIALEAREIETSSETPNSVRIEATGETTASLSRVDLGFDTTTTALGVVATEEAFVREGAIDVKGGRTIRFGRDTSLMAEAIQVEAAALPLELNVEETDGLGVMLPAEERALTRLVFEGTGGNAIASGVRLAADDISLSVGDGTTPSDGLAFVDPGTDAAPTDFGLERGSRGDYAGLQLRNSAGDERPESFSLEQDGDLTITAAAAASAGEIFLGSRSGTGSTGGVFGDARIGANGQRVTLESADGLLTIGAAGGLSSDTTTPGGDAGQSFVTLHGGLLLPDDDMATEPSSDSILVMGPLVGNDAFSVGTLTLTTPRNLTVTDALASSIVSAETLEIEAGRRLDVDGAEGDGQLTLEAGVALQADERLSLRAGASGFGDLVVNDGAATTLQSDEIELRAGAGATSLNAGAADTHSKIVGVGANIELRDAGGADFDGRTGSDLAFTFRQDAAIDSDVDLPDFDNFSAATITSFVDSTAPGANPAFRYSVRSDAGTVDLRGDVLGLGRFENAALSLVGLQSGSTSAIEIDDGASFIGPEIELGGIGSFTFSQALADVFNRDPIANPDQAREQIRLRAGLGGSGTLGFESGVVVRAPRIELVAGDGPTGSTGGRISVGSARFDLSDGDLGERAFVFQEDQTLRVSDLPDVEDFVGGALPNLLALRSDDGALDLSGFDITELPLLLDGVDGGGMGVPARLVLEADAITLSASRGEDLALTASEATPDPATDPLRNVRLRLRTNTLRLEALGSDTPTGPARVLWGLRAGDSATPLPAGSDDTFSDESLLVEAFDAERALASTDNLTAVSQVEDMPGSFDLATGRGPTTITLEQNHAIEPNELARRNAFSGRLARSLNDDPEDAPIATTYQLTSRDGTTTVRSENVSGSALEIGSLIGPSEQTIRFDYVTGEGSNLFDLANVTAVSEGAIEVADGIVMNVEREILLAAAFVDLEPKASEAITTTNPMADLVFEDTAGGTTSLTANQIRLSAGRGGVITNPDGTVGAKDGERDRIEDDALARVDLRGLATVDWSGIRETSVFSLLQSHSLDTSAAGGAGDAITPLAAGSAGEWDRIDLASVQEATSVDRLASLGTKTNELVLGRANEFASVRVLSELAVPFEDPSGVAGFEGAVRIESNDVRFEAAGPNELDLDSPNLRIVSNLLREIGASPEDLGRLASDPDAPERARIQIVQPGDFAATQLPRPDHYLQRLVDPFTSEQFERPLDSLADLDIALESTGAALVLGDAIRERTFMSNLALVSAGDILLDYDGPTPGFGDYDFAAPDIEITDFAALQLNSLDLDANGGEGDIRIRPFTVAGNGADRTLETAGDQRFAGDLELEHALTTIGDDIRMTGDVYSAAGADAGLTVSTTGAVVFEKNVGSSTDDPSGEALANLWVLFDAETRGSTPALLFAPTEDEDDDGMVDMPDQRVDVVGDTVLLATPASPEDDPQDPDDGNRIRDLRAAVEAATSLAEIESAFEQFEVGRPNGAPIATIGKAAGDLTFANGPVGRFLAGGGEKIAVGGRLAFENAGDLMTIGDAAAIELVAEAAEVGIFRRSPVVSFDREGDSFQDGGVSILANTIDFGGAPLRLLGRGRDPRFGVQNPFSADQTAGLERFAVFAARPDGGALGVDDFAFEGSARADQVIGLTPRGASRSELTGAFGPIAVAIPGRPMRERPPLRDAERLLELDVDARTTPADVRLASVRGAAIIDDYGQALAGDEDETPLVTAARLDARDSESAIALHEKIFGSEGERAGDVREVLQSALDRYLETTRARRVIGFELRRFVKNRPSTLLEAYTTLEDLDTLFRYHRRLGLSPGEYRRIQRDWLRSIKPDGITLDELAETIHPSRYVRGSDILDIFGR